jgi:hypothetical protein
MHRLHGFVKREHMIHHGIFRGDSMDLFVVPTISFRLLYGFLILQHSRRKLLWLGVTDHPTAEWIA